MNRIRFGQFRLRTFLAAVIVVGVLVGTAGPLLLELFKRQPRPLPPPASVGGQQAADEGSAYFESAETPLD